MLALNSQACLKLFYPRSYNFKMFDLAVWLRVHALLVCPVLFCFIWQGLIKYITLAGLGLTILLPQFSEFHFIWPESMFLASSVARQLGDRSLPPRKKFQKYWGMIYEDSVWWYKLQLPKMFRKREGERNDGQKKLKSQVGEKTWTDSWRMEASESSRDQ